VGGAVGVVGAGSGGQLLLRCCPATCRGQGRAGLPRWVEAGSRVPEGRGTISARLSWIAP